MLKTRVIPCLLLSKGGLVKTTKFKDPKYIGDPINAVRIFNDKEVDELVFLDIDATCSGVEPNFKLLKEIVSEAFMPFGYGGGITNIDQIKRLYSMGVEKVILNTVAECNPELVSQAALMAGSSSVVVSVDVRYGLFGKRIVCTQAGRCRTKQSFMDYIKEIERRGAGEILLNSIDRDGVMMGYDLDMIRVVADSVNIPVVASGGAGKLQHFKEAVDAGASAVSAGSFFVFHGKHRAVLITYPKYTELEDLFLP